MSFFMMPGSLCNYAAPIAKFTTSTVNGISPMVVNFTDTSTGSPTSWAWTFGDGSTSTLQNPSYTYTATGQFSATLTAYNSVGPNSHSTVITVNSDAALAYVSLLIDGDQGIEIDATGNNSLTPIGPTAPVLSNSIYKYGSGSIYFSGAGAYQITYTSLFNLSLGDYTIESWVYPTQYAIANCVISKDTYGANFDWCLDFPIGGKTVLWQTNRGTQTLLVTVPQMLVNTWYHAAVVSHSGTVTIYLNGVSYGSKVVATTNADTIALSVGCAGYSNPSSYFHGYIDDLRVTNGIARYTANFVPPGIAPLF